MRIALVVSLMIVAAPLSAQTIAGARAGLSQQVRANQVTHTAIAASAELPRTYWLEGTIVGGVLGLVGGLQLQHGLCNFDGPSCSGTDHFIFLLPMLVLSIVGGLIGSAFHKN